jgi:hypothetical protein
MHFCLKFGEHAIERPAAWIENDRPLAAQGRQFETDGFPQAASDAVAEDSFSQRSGRGETHVRTLDSDVGNAKRRKEGTRVTSALVINLAEIARSQDAYTFREARSSRIRDPATSPS